MIDVLFMLSGVLTFKRPVRFPETILPFIYGIKFQTHMHVANQQLASMVAC